MKKANMVRNVFCFGLGFSFLALARRLIPKNWKVSGTTGLIISLFAFTSSINA